MEKGVQFFRKKHIGCILLDRPEALHALSLTMIKAIYKQLLLWKKDESIWAVMIQATPSKAFCAGGDVRWLYGEGRGSTEIFFHEYRLNALTANLGKPYIALMNGITMGGGVGVSLHGSHPIATEKFLFAMPETAIGFFPDVGASHLLSRLPGGLGMYLGLTGQRLLAAEARHMGLVKYVIPEASIEDVVQNVIDIDNQSDISLNIDRCMETVCVEPEVLPLMTPELLKKIEQAFTQPSVEAIFQTLEAFQDDFGRKTLTCLQALSPLSLKVTFEQMEKAAHLDLAGCLAMDECLVKHFIAGHDLYEGVRALLIDKDKSPQWDPPTLSAVSEMMVKSYFI